LISRGYRDERLGKGNVHGRATLWGVVPRRRWTIIFIVIAVIAAIFGFTGIAAGAASIAKIIFFIFLVLVVLSLLFGRRGTDVP